MVHLGAAGILLAIAALVVLLIVECVGLPVGEWPRRCFNGIVTFAALCVLLLLTGLAFGRDDGRYAGDPLKPRFDHLASGKGLCCSIADGIKVEDVDWEPVCDFQGRDADPVCNYRVRLNGQWLTVPDAAVITEPNKAGFAVVWPMTAADGTTQIRCFIAGSGA